MKKNSAPLYKDPSQPVEKRVDDLMKRMTVKEKVGQLVQVNGQADMRKNFFKYHPGSFLQLPDQDYAPAMELARKSRLGIPLLLGVDAIHGNSFLSGSTMFPTQLGMACTWDTDIIRKMAEVTAKEMRYTGMAWTFSPVLCITRDLRWGRVDESFGEDPYLIGLFASAMIKGYQGDSLSPDQDHVMATAKHYAGYSETQGGRDASEADLSRRKLKSYFLPPFKKAAEAGAGAFMTGYQSIEGQPSTMNKWLLRSTLKEEWGFDGLVVTDWNNVGSLVNSQHVCPDFKHAAAVAVESGNDLIMSTPEFYQGCLGALKAGLLDMKYVDEACRRVLSIKFRLGLFEDCRAPQRDKLKKITGCPAHRKYSLQAALESAVLLQNNGILPLNEKKYKKISIVGPMADNALDQCGDWSLGSGQTYRDGRRHPRECTVTALDGIKARFKGKISGKIEKDSDLVIAVVGDSLKYIGEWHSTATLELQDGQNELLEKVRKSGKPYVIVMICSKPQILHTKERDAADAILLQFSPSMLGGTALAKILFGDENPSGRLTVSFPYHVGQQPIGYMQVRGQHGAYSDITSDPLYAFGYGLLYTKMEYKSAELEVKGRDLVCTVRVKNSGKRDGIEVVQAYVSDTLTSATWVDMQLKGFARIKVPAGKTVTAKIVIPVAECDFVNADGERVVEPGDFELLGMSAQDIKFKLPFSIDKKMKAKAL